MKDRNGKFIFKCYQESRLGYGKEVCVTRQDIQVYRNEAIRMVPRFGHLPKVKFLGNGCGANIHVMSEGHLMNAAYFGKQALVVSVMRGHLPLVKYLVSQGIDVEPLLK